MLYRRILFLFTLLATPFLSLQAALPEYPVPISLSAVNPYFEVPYRILVTKDPNGYAVELDDGSHWQVVQAGERANLRNWLPNDRLVIRPTLFPSWTGARFYLLNERLNDTIYVELSMGPLAGLATTNTIYWTSPSTGALQLIDGLGRTSNWVVHPEDISTFSLWQQNQAVIIGALTGSYAGWFANYNPGYILINVERNVHIRAALQ